MTIAKTVWRIGWRRVRDERQPAKWRRRYVARHLGIVSLSDRAESARWLSIAAADRLSGLRESHRRALELAREHRLDSPPLPR